MTELLNQGHPPLARSASAAAVEIIREAILDGRLHPGQRLKENELAEQLGISRTPVREALLVLQAEGLIESLPNRGASVRSYQAADLEDMYRLRAVLEGHAAHQAASRVTPEVIAELRASNTRFDELRGGDQVVELARENNVFHETIVRTASSDRLAEMLRKVVELPLVYRSFIWYSPEQKMISLHYHQQITAALESRDAERAELIMKEHVYEASDFLIAELRARGDTFDPEEAA